MIKSVAFISLSLAALVGCSGGEDKPPVKLVDAPDNNPTPDAPDQGACTAPAASPGGMAMLPFEYTKDSMPDDGDPQTPPAPAGDQESWDTGLVALNQDAKPDAIYIGFYEGGGTPGYTTADYPNATMQNPITIQLNGEESSITSCSACLGMLTDVDTAAQMYAHDYFANTGTITLTALSAQKITGTIAGLSMRHVQITSMPFAQTDDPSGCTATVGDLTFDVVPTMAMAKDGRRGLVVKVPLRGHPLAIKNANLAQ